MNPLWILWKWRKKNWLAFAIKESNDHVLANKRPFWVKFGAVLNPPGPPIFHQDRPCGLQISPNTPPWVKEKRIDLIVQWKSQIIMFYPKNRHFESNLGVFSAPQGPQCLTRTDPVGSKFHLILPPESKKNKLTWLCSQRVKLSWLTKKRSFSVKFGGVFRPPRAPNTWPGWPLWAPNFP